MFNTVNVDKDNYSIFRNLMLPRHLGLFKEAEVRVEALGILLEDQPIGISIAELEVNNNKANVTYFTVRVEEDHNLAVNILLLRTEEVLKTKGYTSFELILHTDADEEEMINIFLEKGWTPSLPMVTSFICSPPELHRHKWLTKLSKFKSVEIVPWKNLHQSEVSKLKNDTDQWSFNYLISFRAMERFDKDTSFALCVESEIKGWIICEKIASNMILCQSFYVKASDRLSGGGLLLLAELMKKAAEYNLYTMFYVEDGNVDMKNILLKRLRETIIKEKRVIKFWK
ncbi:hypothetical protein JOC78_001382 [Bacillus ectoiniformans]|uniref:hypothetical protein n=1 Tax=Bacillus ectoiniformans TaxID=1494429 RepID=UPI0019564E50|nr:hypothetical protein [Bacillus ectoiniformans]MBM7648440.1 hypothetical protein [Bacillus ectoiniformans]